MARNFTGASYAGPDGLLHFPWIDDLTGEQGEELMLPDGSPQSNDPQIGPDGTINGGPSPVPHPATPAASVAPPAPAYQFPFLPNYQNWAGKQPGYQAGMGTYNQWRLDTPGLFDSSGYNLQTGSGGPGDPNTGREQQTPVALRQGGPLFIKTDPTKNLPDEYINVVNNFLRSDAGGSGLGSAQPTPQDFAALQRAIAAGLITPSASGKAFLQQQGIPYSGPVASGAGGAAGSGDPMSKLLADNAAKNAANEAAQLAYQAAILQGQRDDRAMQAARDAWSKTYQEAQLTGTYNGQPIASTKNQQDATALGVLGLGAQMKGPSNYLQYLRTLSNTPGGLKDAVNALAGRFNLSSSQGTTPGSQFERQSLGTMVRDLNAAPGGTDPDNGFVRPGGPGGTDLSGANLPGGSQWNARNFGILAQNPTQVGLLRSLYEESGRDWNTELANFASSLPKFQGARTASYALGGQ